MPSDAAIAPVTPLAAVAPAAAAAPSAQRQPGAGESASFAALVDGGDAGATTGEASLPINLLPPGFAESPAPAAETPATPASPTPAVRPANDLILAAPARTPPQAQGDTDSLPDLSLPAEPAAPELPVELAEALPAEGQPDDTQDVADAGASPVPTDVDPAILLAQSLPVATQQTAVLETVAVTDAPAPAFGTIGSVVPGQPANDDSLADASIDANGAMPPPGETEPKAEARPARAAAKPMPPGEEAVREAAANPAAPVPTPAADRPGAAVDLAVRALYQAQPDAAAAPTATAVVQARSGQVGHDVGAVIKREIVSGREEVTVRLDPPELGRIHIRLSFESAGQLRAVVATETTAALDLLRRDVHQLDRALADAGVQTDAQSFRFDDRQASSGFGRSGSDQGGSAPSRSQGQSVERDDHLPVRQALHGRVASGRVDMIA